MDRYLDPKVTYYGPFTGFDSAHLTPNHVTFPSDLNAYQGASISPKPNGRCNHPSHGASSSPSPLENIPKDTSLGELPQDHVSPAGQLHRGVQEHDTRWASLLSLLSLSPYWLLESDESNRPYKCGWIHCTNTKGFKRSACLLRHIKSIHVSAGEFQCPHCRRKFNRKDKVKAHIQTVHASKRHSGVSTCGCSQHWRDQGLGVPLLILYDTVSFTIISRFS